MKWMKQCCQGFAWTGWKVPEWISFGKTEATFASCATWGAEADTRVRSLPHSDQVRSCSWICHTICHRTSALEEKYSSCWIWNWGLHQTGAKIHVNGQPWRPLATETAMTGRIQLRPAHPICSANVHFNVLSAVACFASCHRCLIMQLPIKPTSSAKSLNSSCSLGIQI